MYKFRVRKTPLTIIHVNCWANRLEIVKFAIDFKAKIS